jgi:predicted PurR-regulated permease PerM
MTIFGNQCALKTRFQKEQQGDTWLDEEAGQDREVEVLLQLKPYIEDSASGWFTRERLLTLALTLLTLGFIYLCFLLVAPFISAIAFAVALAVATQGPFEWLRSRFNSRAAASAVAIALVIILILLPLGVLGTYIARTAVESINELRSGESDWQSVINRQPQLRELVMWATENLDLQAQLQRLSETIASRAASILGRSIDIITQLAITLFVLFFLYRDGHAALRALPRLVPLSRDEMTRLQSRISTTIRATVNGSLTIALVQSLLAGIVYLVLGVPGTPLWASATFVAALVPVFGTALVWGPIAAYLMLTGAWTKAIILLAWGGVAVSSIDNILYPLLVGDTLRLHTVTTFFAIFGGIAMFGPVGLILGPLVLSITIVLLDIWWYRTEGGQAAEEKIEDANSSGPPGAVLQKKEATKRKYPKRSQGATA